MHLSVCQRLHGFSVQTAEALPEIEGDAYTLLHEESGAKLLYLANADVNKAFSISFKTPPADDTGVFHILEHSVLCGSDRFPVKEPFVNLLKNSMQTFLNAMTFDDKTMYPVASTNEQDLLNLADVYLDAVLHPAIYHKPTIFQQEGWHLEVEDGETGSGLVHNGVVFNEMKGALSSPDSVLYDTLQTALFPDTAYRFESGGDPDAIPELSYEAFLDHHARHYRLDNSYLVLYGDLDADRFLGFLDERYLAPCANPRHDVGAPNPLGEQAPVKNMDVRREMVTSADNSALALGFVNGRITDHLEQLGMSILLDAIAGSNESPLKRALLDAELAVDVRAFLSDSVLQPFVVLQLNNLKDGAGSRFWPVVRETVQGLVGGGLDYDLVLAALSHEEFVMREADYGTADGVVYAMASLSGWLYDDALATTYLRYEDDFRRLRELLDEGWFEGLLRKVFLENGHMAQVELVPVERRENDPQAAKLEALAASLDEEGFEAIRADVAVLREAQEAPDTPEQLATLPHLTVADIGLAPEKPACFIQEGLPLRTLRHTVGTKGIAYAFRHYDLAHLSVDDLPYVRVLGLLLGKLATAEHSAIQLDTLMRTSLGEFSTLLEVHEDMADPAACLPKLVVTASALGPNAALLASLPDEVLTSTSFADHDRIRDILAQRKVRIEQAFSDSGHTFALNRVAAQYLPSAVLRERISGVDYYRFLSDLVEHFDERVDDLVAKLADLAKRIFRDDNCTLSFAGTDAELGSYLAAHEPMRGTGSLERALVIPPCIQGNEVFAVPTNVTYSAVGFDRRKLGVEHSGLWSLASRMLSLDYLWNEVRVKGGAYGVGFSVTRAGNLRFYSFRDPHVELTLERFAKAGEWLGQHKPDAEEFEGYQVSVVAAMDMPVKPRALIRQQDGWFFAGITPEDLARTRAEVIEATPDAVRVLGEAVERVTEAGHVCVFGNRELIEASGLDFELVDLVS